MTYPPSPYGGYPGPGNPQQYGQPQQYGYPQQHNTGDQLSYGPSGPVAQGPLPGGYGQQGPAVDPGRKKQNLQLGVILAIVLVVLVSAGAWLFWPNSARHQRVVAESSQQVPKGNASLRGRSKEELLKALPTLQDMPHGWKEEPQGSGMLGAVDPEGCVRVIPKGALTPVINRYFDNPEDHSKSGIEAYLFQWNGEPQLDKVKDFIGRCATYTRTIGGVNGNPDTVYTINVHEADPPKTPAESSIGYEEGGTLSPVQDGQDPALTPERYYIGSLRGINVIIYCRNSTEIKDKCDDVFVRTVTQLANIN